MLSILGDIENFTTNIHFPDPGNTNIIHRGDIRLGKHFCQLRFQLVITECICRKQDS